MYLNINKYFEKIMFIKFIKIYCLFFFVEMIGFLKFVVEFVFIIVFVGYFEFIVDVENIVINICYFF